MKTYKRKVLKVEDKIYNATRDGLYGFDKNKPYSIAIYKIIDRERIVYKYFKTEQEAINFKNRIKKELIEGLYNDWIKSITQSNRKGD